MPNCTQARFDFPPLKRRRIEADFQGGDITSDGGVLLPCQVEQFIASFKRAPKKLVLDIDATDDAVHGKLEERFFLDRIISAHHEVVDAPRLSDRRTGDELPG